MPFRRSRVFVVVLAAQEEREVGICAGGVVPGRGARAGADVREEVAAQGVVYTDMESALTGEYADMVKKHFMKLVKPTDHKFAALHGAVWVRRFICVCTEGCFC